MLQIKTYSPCEELKEIVQCYWTLESNSVIHTERVISNTDSQFIFHFKEPFNVIPLDKKAFTQPQSCFCGVSTKPKEVLTSLSSSMFGVVFFPHTVKCFLPYSMNEFTNYSIDINLISKEFTELEHKMYECTTDSTRIKLIENFLIGRLSKTLYDSKAKSVHNLISLINKSSGIIKQEDLINISGFSERHIQRLFNEYLGVPPKKFLEIKRVEATIPLIKSSSNLTEVAYAAGYYDQSHFINSFKHYTGITPKEFRKMSD